ncbi:CU044_5270 family protein [Actinomadura nitritigenes]|uniref:CU044_5270 family protein n=1 Tax=Actinomadura nitritigenes TaxID=134602 RepID=UPI003D924775
MTTGEKMNDADTAFRALKPAALDELAAETHDRVRDAELVRIMRTSAGPAPVTRAVTRRSRRPLLLAAGVAAAAVAVAGGVAVTGGDGGHEGRHTPPAQSSPVDARTFLLASARTAERAPARPGRYWYTDEVTYEHHTKAEAGGLRKLQEKTRAARGAKSPAPGAKTAVKAPGFAYTVVTGQESWLSRTGRDRSRTITGIGARTSFPTAADQAAWRRAGSPDLLVMYGRGGVNNYDGPLRYQIGDVQVTTADLLKLPVTADALGAEMRRRHDADARKRSGVGSYADYLWWTAQDLLAGPITPGTKAALYRLLADQSGIRAEGTVTDRAGRRGVAVSRAEGTGHRRLIIDPETAELLADEYFGGTGSTPFLSMTYKAMGWVDSLNDRP